jgi:hypothetical protein
VGCESASVQGWRRANDRGEELAGRGELDGVRCHHRFFQAAPACRISRGHVLIDNELVQDAIVLSCCLLQFLVVQGVRKVHHGHYIHLFLFSLPPVVRRHAREGCELTAVAAARDAYTRAAAAEVGQGSRRR